MSIADRVREMTETLPVEKQAEVLDFVEFLRNRTSGEAKLREAERATKMRSERFGALRDAFAMLSRLHLISMLLCRKRFYEISRELDVKLLLDTLVHR